MTALARTPSVRSRRFAVAGLVATAGIAAAALAITIDYPLRLAGSDVDAGPRTVLLFALFASLAAVPALVRGKRVGLIVSLVASAASVVAYTLNGVDVVGLSLAAAALVTLLATRRLFTARSTVPGLRGALAWLLVGEGVVLAYGILGLFVLGPEFRQEPTLAESAREALQLLFLQPASSLGPATEYGSWFVHSVRILSLAVLGASLARALVPVVGAEGRRQHDRERVAALLESWGDSALAHFHLLPGKSWFFGPDGQAFVSYRVVASTAVVLGAPVGSPGSCERALVEFAKRCDRNGWTQAFHQVREEDRPLLERHGFQLLRIGSEAVIPVAEFSLSGRRMKSLRSSVNHAVGSGLIVEELPRDLDEDTFLELKAVSDAWLAEGHRERTFTVGQFDRTYLRDTTVLAVREAAGRIVAFANVLPSYRCQEGNFDLMRRRPDAPNGAMELLFLTMIERFRAAGLQGMNLGLAPLAQVEGDDAATRVLRALRDYGERWFSFKGLEAFKDKWGPRWEPRYLAYQSPLDLPRIAIALGRVGELESPRLRRWLQRSAHAAARLRFTMLVSAITLWFMLVTQVDPGFHARLIEWLGLSWPDIAGFEWWRIVTSTFVQAHAGFQWSILVLLAVTLPVAEWRLGTRRAAAVFFLGDWVSSIAVLAALAALGALGNAPEAALAATRAAGTSSALYAAGFAAAISFTGRLRQGLVLGIAAWLAVLLVAHRGTADFAHVAAAGVAVALTWRWRLWPDRRPRWPRSALTALGDE